MFQNYLKIALRNLWRNKIYAFINILGLAIGMTCTILLYLYIQHETSYDDYHKDKAQLYRIENKLNFGDKSYHLSVLPAILAPTLEKEYPAIEVASRTRGLGKKVLKLDNRKFYQSDIYYADASIFQIFTFTPIAGDTHQALKRPKTMVLTRSLANKLFRSPQKALGQSFIMDDSVSYLVTAVIEDIPSNSHFKPQALASMSTYYKTHPQQFTNWRNYGFNTFLKLKKGKDPAVVEASLVNIYHKYMKEKGRKDKNDQTKMNLRALDEVYLHAKLDSDYADTGDARTVYIFVIIGGLILLIACANYMNLATARSVERAKEVGIRKVVGSYQKQLIGQFLLESMLLSVLALMISLSLIEVLLPQFNQLAGKKLTIAYATEPQILLMLLGITLLTGLISGSYPAFILSGFKPYQVLKGKFSHSRQGNTLRKGLVIFQFSISIMMIIGTLIVYQQMQFVHDKELGYDQERTLTLSFMNKEESKKFPVIKQKLLQNPRIKAVTGASFGMDDGFNVDDMLVEQNNGVEKISTVLNYFVASDYIPSLGMKIAQGRNFESKNSSDLSKSVIVNEAFVRKYGWQNPIGKKIGYGLKKGKAQKHAKVVGVVADFHIESLYKPIEPLMMFLAQGSQGNLEKVFVKFNANQTQQTLKQIQTTWEALQPKHPYKGEFLDQRAASAYKADQKRGQVFLIFSVLAVLIACMGLFGLASFTARQRVKEIGIRKVLGASVTQILLLLSRGFAKLVLVSSLVAFPLAYYFMDQWLQNFAYRTSLHGGVFVLAGSVTFLIALLTVSFQSLRAARANPVEVLKDE